MVIVGLLFGIAILVAMAFLAVGIMMDISGVQPGRAKWLMKSGAGIVVVVIPVGAMVEAFLGDSGEFWGKIAFIVCVVGGMYAIEYALKKWRRRN